jgi:hypothetical protein
MFVIKFYFATILSVRSTLLRENGRIRNWIRIRVRIREAQKSYGTDPTDPEHCWHRYRYHTVPVPTIYGRRRIAYRYTSAFLCSRKIILITFICRLTSPMFKNQFKYNT